MPRFDLAALLERWPGTSPWRDRLPHTLERACARWNLGDVQPFEHLSFNFAARVRRSDGTDAVLKVGPPDELRHEIAALEHYAEHGAGGGCVRLLEADVEAGAFLLERLEPGTMLSHLVTETPTLEAEEQATRIACARMRALWHPPSSPHPYPPIEDWYTPVLGWRERWATAPLAIPRDLLERLDLELPELLSSMGQRVVLHGDLHHFNVLSHGAGWTVIDPKGVLGEREAEVGPFFYNPAPHLQNHPDLERIVALRLEVMAEALERDRERLRRWAFAACLLSAWWCLEDDLNEWMVGPLRAARALADLG